MVGMNLYSVSNKNVVFMLKKSLVLKIGASEAYRKHCLNFELKLSVLECQSNKNGLE